MRVVDALAAALVRRSSRCRVLLAVPEIPRARRGRREQVGFFASYARLVPRHRARSGRRAAQTVWFLLASARVPRRARRRLHLRRRARGGRLRLLGRRGHHLRDRRERRRRHLDHRVGALDDRLGAKPVIVTALIGLVVSGLVVFLLHDGGADRVLDLRPRALPLRRPRAVGEPHVPRPAHPGRARGRGLRPLRDDRPRGELPRADGCSRCSSRSAGRSTGASSASCS